MEAAAVLRNSGKTIRLVFGRPKTQERVDEREMEEEEAGKTGTYTLKYCFFGVSDCMYIRLNSCGQQTSWSNRYFRT